MSDLPDLPLFEEIEDISTSKNFLTYTQEEFNKTWNYYETESMPPEEKSLWNSPVRNQTSSPASTSGKSSPTRDEWDPMLWNMTLTKYVELEDLGQVAKTPFTPAMTSIDIMRCSCQQNSAPQRQAPTKSRSGRTFHHQGRKQNSCSQPAHRSAVYGESCYPRKVK